MNKAFYIISLIFSVVFIIVVSYYVEEVSSARLDYLISSYSSYDSYGSTYVSSSYYEEYTMQGGLISLFFILFFITTELLGLLKVKTKTTKVMSIIGISLGGLFLLWDLAVIASPGAMSFDEVGPGFVFYALIVLAFSIVGLIQSIRFANRKSAPATGSDLLDS